MIIIWTVLLGIACYRAWRILALDSITESFRDWLLERADWGGWRGTAWSYLADLILCPWCLGWWYCGVGAWLISDDQAYNPTEFALLWLGASAICGATHTVLARLTD